MGLPRPIVFGNWKMHGLRAEARALAGGLAERARDLEATLGVFPPFTVLHEIAEQLEGTGILVGAQDCHEAAKGAFTGSVSAAMVRAPLDSFTAGGYRLSVLLSALAKNPQFFSAPPLAPQKTKTAMNDVSH